MNRPLILLSACALLALATPTRAFVQADDTAIDEAIDDIVAAPVTEGVVTVRLLPDTTHWFAGRDHLVGVHFKMEAGWHLYWRGQNDSGLPIQVTPVVPTQEPDDERLAIGPLRWPAPVRLVHEGGLVDHVYHDAVTLLLPVHVPADAVPGARLTLRVETDWLVCMEACLPGAAVVSLSMTVAPEDSPRVRAPEADLLGAALDRMPSSMADDIEIAWTGVDRVAYQITAPLAERMAFYPDADGVALMDIANSCAALGPRLIIQLDPHPPFRPDATGPAHLRGLLEVWYGGGRPSRLSVVDFPGPDSRPDTATTPPTSGARG